ARGSEILRMRIREKRMVQAITNRMPAKVIGGRSARPSLINSQVEPQMPQRINQTRRAFIAFQSPNADYQLATGNWQSAMKLSVWLRFDDRERSTLRIGQDRKTSNAGDVFGRLHDVCAESCRLLNCGVSILDCKIDQPVRR